MARLPRRSQSAVTPPVIAGRTPPSNLDLESAVLSACLLDATALDTVIGILDAKHFYADANGRIFEAAAELANAHKPVDLVTVAEWLRSRGRLESVGGTSYLAQISDCTPSVQNVETHAHTVRELWRLRQIIATCQRVAAEGYGSVGEPKAFIEAAEQDIFAIASDNASVSSGPRRLSDAMRSATSRLMAMADQGSNLRGVTYGYPELDRMTSGLKAGELCVIAARPSVGKSALMQNVATNVAKAGHGVLVFSVEMPEEDLGERALAAEARANLSLLASNRLADYGPVTDAASRTHDLDIWLECSPDVGLSDIRATLRRHVAQRSAGGHRPVSVVAIDYLQILRGDPDAETESIRLGQITRGLKIMAKKFGIAVVLLSQLNRDVETRGGNAKRPQLSDLKGSGSIEQDADTVIFLHRDSYQQGEQPPVGPAEAILAKQRNGPLGTVHLTYYCEQTRFESAAGPPEYARTRPKRTAATDWD